MNTTFENQAVRGTIEDGIATLTLAMPKVNIINALFGAGLAEAVEWAAGHDSLAGVIIATAHRDFCAGADLETLYAERDPQALLTRTSQLGALYRRIETLGVPVVAALTGTALGGGYELALACTHRIAVDNPKLMFGLPEVSLGVIPGAGGTQRLPRMIGIQAALELIAQGKTLRAPKALEAGLVDALAPTPEALLDQAKAYIRSNPKATQPWDNKGFSIPGPAANSADGRNLLMAASAMLRKKTAGVFPAPERAISAVSEGLALTFDRALEVEQRYFVELATSDQAKDMMRTLWFHRNAAQKHEGLPSLGPDESAGIESVAILGAGMMGAGLAYVCAKAGYKVFLKDIKQEALDAGVAHFDAQLQKRGKHLSPEGKAEIRHRLVPTIEQADLKDVDLVIEAVFENLELKHRVNQTTEPALRDDGIWASNTSALPIADLATSSKQAERFIGLHFFSPVEQMPLVEIIEGPQTDERTVARSLAFSKSIGKLPIVVGDGYAFFTTRVFSSYILEGAQLVGEGHDPVLIEWAARQAGMVVSPLQVFDEVTLTLGIKATEGGKTYMGEGTDLPGIAVVRAMVEKHDRPSKAEGRGFYEYDKGKRRGLWKGLATLSSAAPEQTGVDYLADRLLLVQANQAAHCVDSGLIRRNRDADVGAVFGIGFAPNTGGPLAYLDRLGIANAVTRLDQLADACGERYRPPALLRRMAERGERFYPGSSTE